MFKIITCILLCFEKCLKFITKNAYIMIAMQGHAFCDSCCHAFKLLLTNLLQFVLVSCFSKVVILLGKITITCSCVFAAYFWLSRAPEFQEWQPTELGDEGDGITGTRVVNNKVIPCVLVALLGYGCGAAFLYVYDLAIASILLCFCEDYKVHQVDDPHFPDLHKEVYMPNSLRRIVLSPKEFAHMNKPLTQEQIMNMAGISDDDGDVMKWEEIIDFCRELLVKSQEFHHLHIPEHELSDKIIIEHTGGHELAVEMRRPNPMYDKEWALAVSQGRAAVKLGHNDARLHKYRPDLTMDDLIAIIERANKLHSQGDTMTHEALVARVASKHGEDVAKQISETPSRMRIRKHDTALEERKKRKNKIQPITEEATPVTAVGAEVNEANKSSPRSLKTEEII